MKCPKCKKNTLKHLHDCAHGVIKSHMIGSERFECKCGFYIGDKNMAEKYNLKFIVDI